MSFLTETLFGANKKFFTGEPPPPRFARSPSPAALRYAGEDER